MENTQFVGMDITNPNLNMKSIAEGFGARVSEINSPQDILSIIEKAFQYQGPGFIIINRER